MPSRKPLINLVIDEELRDRLDDFRYQNRFPSRAAAIKWLLNRGLEQQSRPVERIPVGAWVNGRLEDADGVPIGPPAGEAEP